MTLIGTKVRLKKDNEAFGLKKGDIVVLEKSMVDGNDMTELMGWYSCYSENPNWKPVIQEGDFDICDD